MPKVISLTSNFILLAGWLLLIGCQQDDNAELTLKQQLAKQWQLDDLRATVELGGTDYKVFLAQLADSFGLAPEEIAIGLLLAESQITQGLLDREPVLNLRADNSFNFQQIDRDALLGNWQLSDDEQQLLLLSEEDEELLFSIVAVDENKMILHIDQAPDFLTNISQISQQLDIQLEMEWITDELQFVQQ